MSERAFRAVVAAVLVGALALAVVLAAVILLPAPAPTPGPSVAPRSTPSLRPSATAAPTAGPVFGVPTVVGVGQVVRGSQSATTLALEFLEPGIDAIPDAPGSLRVTLTDRDGNGSTVEFTGTPSVSAPGSLGVTVVRVATNVLMIEIVGSDRLNVEPITITGLGIGVGSTAAIGPLGLDLGAFSGSLAAGTEAGEPASPGSVVEQP